MAEPVQCRGNSSYNKGAVSESLRSNADPLGAKLRELRTESKPGDLTFKFCTDKGVRMQRNGLLLPAGCPSENGIKSDHMYFWLQTHLHGGWEIG